MNSNCCKLNDKELESVIKELETADINHLCWLKELHSSLICQQPFDSDVLAEDAHKHCRFGSWYYGNAPKILYHRKEFIAIDEQHKAMHDTARDLASQHNDNQQISKTEYESFITKQRLFSKNLVELRDQLREHLHSFDALTGLMTRGPFTHILNTECSRAERDKQPCCLVLIDIDHFKQINDTYGHVTGDRALSRVAQYLLHNIRNYDSICRYGGEEFLVSLPMTNIQKAVEIMDRLRNELQHHTIDLDDTGAIFLTISIGISEIQPGEQYEQCIKNADNALYEAKRNGRNKVCTYSQNNGT